MHACIYRAPVLQTHTFIGTCTDTYTHTFIHTYIHTWAVCERLVLSTGLFSLHCVPCRQVLDAFWDGGIMLPGMKIYLHVFFALYLYYECTNMHAWIHMHTSYIPIYMITYLHAYMHAYMHTYIHTHILSMQIHTYVHVYVHDDISVLHSMQIQWHVSRVCMDVYVCVCVFSSVLNCMKCIDKKAVWTWDAYMAYALQICFMVPSTYTNEHFGQFQGLSKTSHCQHLCPIPAS